MRTGTRLDGPFSGNELFQKSVNFFYLFIRIALYCVTKRWRYLLEQKLEAIDIHAKHGLILRLVTAFELSDPRVLVTPLSSRRCSQPSKSATFCDVWSDAEGVWQLLPAKQPFSAFCNFSSHIADDAASHNTSSSIA